MIELHSAVMVGTFSGFVACFFQAHGETYAKVVNWAEDNSTTCPVRCLEIIS